MKKLLGLLGILTITSSVISTTNLIINTNLINNINNKSHLLTTKLKRLQPVIPIEKNNKYIVTKIKGIEHRISSMAIDSQGNVYYGTSIGTVYKVKNNETIATKVNGMEHNSRIEEIAIDEKDNVFFATSTGGYELKYNETSISKILGIEEYVWKTLIDSENNVYFVSNIDGIYKLIINQSKAEKITEIKGKISAFIIDNNNNKFYSILNKGAYLLKNGEKKPIKICGIKKKISYFSITFFDKKNNIYVGIDNRLFIIKYNENWITKINNINTQVRAISEDKNGNIIIGTDNKGAYLLFSTELIKQNPKAVLINELGNNSSINAITIDSQNNVYYGLHMQGLYILENNKKTPIKVDEINSSVFIIKISNQDKIYVSEANYSFMFDNEYVISMKH